MIARVRLALPFVITILKDETLETIEYEERGYHITISPPYQAELNQTETQLLDSISMREAINKLSPVALPLITQTIQIDGKPVFQANALQKIFQKDNFDRRTALPQEKHDPTEEFIFKVANDFLSKFRSVTQGTIIKLLNRTIWKLEYLTDTGGELPQNPDLFRATFGYTGNMAWTLLNQELITKIKSLPQNYEMQTWETLILDAEALLPDVRASVVLAYSALETLIAVALDYFVTTTQTPPELWKWINKREWLKNPSVEEQYTKLLKILINKSLKDDLTLWRAFDDLRSARNKIAHTGKPILNGREINSEQARQLVGGAKNIINWVEQLLPESMRRPIYATHMNVNIIKSITN